MDPNHAVISRLHRTKGSSVVGRCVIQINKLQPAADNAEQRRSWERWEHDITMQTTEDVKVSEKESDSALH